MHRNNNSNDMKTYSKLVELDISKNVSFSNKTTSSAPQISPNSFN